MWIRGLEVDGFGDHREHRPGRLVPGLNLVLGANEAGKSTLLEAIRCGLFGFAAAGGGERPQRVSLELVQQDGEVLRVERRRDAAGDSLRVLAADGSELGAERLHDLLGSVDRRHYASVYAFALDELQHLGTLSGTAVQNRIVGATFGASSISPQDAVESLDEELESLVDEDEGELADRTARLRALTAELAELAARREQQLLEEQSLGECEQRIDELHRRIEELRREQRASRGWSEVEELVQRLRDRRAAIEELAVPERLDAAALETFEELVATRAKYEAAEERVLAELAPAREQLERAGDHPSVLAAEEEIRRLDQQAAMAEEHAEQWRETSRELAEVETELEQLLTELGPGWDERRAARVRPGEDDLEALIQLGEDLVQLRRGLGLERLRLAQRLQQQAPRDRRLLVLLSVAGAALVGLGLMGFLAGPDAGLLTTLVSLVLAAGLLLWGWRERVPETEAMVAARRQLVEIDQALKSRPSAASALPMVRQLAKIQGELETQRARVGLPAQTGVEETPQVLRSLRRLHGLSSRREALLELRATLEQRLEKGEKLGAELAARFALDPPPRGELGVLAHRLQEELARARAAQLERGHAERDLEHLERDLERVLELQRRAERRLSSFLAELAVTGEHEVRALAERVERRRRLAIQAEELERALDDKARDLGLDGGWREVLRRVEDRSARPRSVADDLELARDELERWIGRRGELAERQRHGGLDDAYRRALAERTRLRAEIAAAARRALVCRLATELLEGAKTRFERERQGPVIDRASRIFERVTGGRYRRLGVPLGASQLVLERADGYRISRLDTLSRGTREELYLAVRLAFIAESCGKGEPLPVLLDDVLVNADPERAARAAAVIGELAEQTQVVFCTCQPHIARLFESAARARRIELEPMQLAAAP